jgi:hypothetical protein
VLNPFVYRVFRAVAEKGFQALFSEVIPEMRPF